jgi:transposase
LRRRRHRWKIERTNAWLQGYGRIAIRKDRLGVMFLGWLQLAQGDCAILGNLRESVKAFRVT